MQNMSLCPLYTDNILKITFHNIAHLASILVFPRMFCQFLIVWIILRIEAIVRKQLIPASNTILIRNFDGDFLLCIRPILS